MVGYRLFAVLMEWLGVDLPQDSASVTVRSDEQYMVVIHDGFNYYAWSVVVVVIMCALVAIAYRSKRSILQLQFDQLEAQQTRLRNQQNYNRRAFQLQLQPFREHHDGTIQDTIRRLDILRAEQEELSKYLQQLQHPSQLPPHEEPPAQQD